MRFFILFLLTFFVFTPAAAAWNFDKHSIPIDEIMSGGPPKDGIPALTGPRYVSAQSASFLKKEDYSSSKLAEKYNMHNRLKIYPFKPYSQMLDLLAGCDYGLLSNGMKNGMGTKKPLHNV